MAVDERNFRSTYYEKVGFKSVEEKKSLEILLKDKTLDRIKLKQFCLRFSVPVIYRTLVWKVLLDVIPVQVDLHRFVMEQRRQECKDLVQALLVMKVVDGRTPKPQLLYAMWLMHTGKLPYKFKLQDILKDNGFTLIASVMQKFFDDESELYWLIKQFYGYVQKFESDIQKLTEATVSLMEKEDAALHAHFVKTRLFNRLSATFHLWFDSCLAGILNENALGRIWDKLCGGSCKILSFVIVVLFMNQRHKLLKCTTADSVVQCVTNLPEETAEMIASKAIEMWQQHGSPLTVHDKPKP